MSLQDHAVIAGLDCYSGFQHLQGASHDAKRFHDWLIDPNGGELKWVTAGHPPGLVRRNDGSVHDLAGTTSMLGAHSYAEFTPNQQAMKMQPGEVVIVYTDGAFEARNVKGERFGIHQLREIARFNPPPRSWPRFLATAVSKHLHGASEDDMLIASLRLCSYRIVQREHPSEMRPADAVAS